MMAQPAFFSACIIIDVPQRPTPHTMIFALPSDMGRCAGLRKPNTRRPFQPKTKMPRSAL